MWTTCRPDCCWTIRNICSFHSTVTNVPDHPIEHGFPRARCWYGQIWWEGGILFTHMLGSWCSSGSLLNPHQIVFIFFFCMWPGPRQWKSVDSLPHPSTFIFWKMAWCNEGLKVGCHITSLKASVFMGGLAWITTRCCCWNWSWSLEGAWVWGIGSRLGIAIFCCMAAVLCLTTKTFFQEDKEDMAEVHDLAAQQALLRKQYREVCRLSTSNLDSFFVSEIYLNLKFLIL